MIEQIIEAAFMAKIAELNLPGLAVYGFWQPTETGIPKCRESAAPAVLGVIIAPRSFETFTSAKASITTVTTLKVRRDLCPTGAELATYTKPLFDLFQTWQTSINQVKTDFTLADENEAPIFTPHGFKIDGGNVSTDQNEKTWIVTQTFTLRGVI